ncbi:MAG TPA: Xaa-Pro peptidase family protein [Anaerolineales bacterium]|nr:Xaa-Pro peptidase family protein [Anaerolineales bacterium]
MKDHEIIREKISQAIGILGETAIDLWLTFVRETREGGDPVVPLIYGTDLTWQSALILTRSGDRIAIVGRHEADAARSLGAYQVIPYDEGISPDLVRTLTRLDPASIAINESRDDVLADGLTLGMYRLLTEYLSGTPYADRFVSAEAIISRLRARKTPAEVTRIRQALADTMQIYGSTFDYLEAGQPEKQIAAFMHAQVNRLGLRTAWEPEACPAVNTGPDSPVGHAAPGNLKVAPGHLVHFDFGVSRDGFASDIQRTVYVLRNGETEPPPEVKHGFETIVQAIRAAAATLKPGALGREVDDAARSVVVEAGYPEYKYATGHQLGRAVHDGGALLGPLWERYGDLPNGRVEAGHVYTIEPGLAVPGHGYIGIEEDVLVTENGVKFLTPPQTELILVHPS